MTLDEATNIIQRLRYIAIDTHGHLVFRYTDSGNDVTAQDDGI